MKMSTANTIISLFFAVLLSPQFAAALGTPKISYIGGNPITVTGNNTGAGTCGYLSVGIVNPEKQLVKMGFFDVSRKLVKEFPSVTAPYMIWDGKDLNGVAVPKDVYSLALFAGDVWYDSKFILVDIGRPGDVLSRTVTAMGVQIVEIPVDGLCYPELNISTGTVTLILNLAPGSAYIIGGSKINIAISVVKPGTVKAVITDTSGEVLWETSKFVSDGTVALFSWAGSDANAQTVPGALYSVHVTGPGIDARKSVELQR